MGKHGIDDLVYSKAREVVYEQVKWTATENTFRRRIVEKFDSKFSDCLAEAIANSKIGSAIGIPVEDRDSIMEIACGRSRLTEQEEELTERLTNLPIVLDSTTVGQFLTTLRLVDCGMTEVDKSLRRLKNLRLLNLSGNGIAILPGDCLPRKIRFLELYRNRIEDVRSLTSSIPNCLIHLGIARNKLTDRAGLEMLSKNEKAILRSLDIAENDLENLKEIISGLSPLPLTSLRLEGNPCSMNPSYVSEVASRLPKLLYLDGGRLDDVEYCGNASNGGLVFRCFGLTGLEREECNYRAELEIPLFDPVRRLSVIEAILNGRNGTEDVLRFPTERTGWSDQVNFPDLIVRLPYFAGLTELRDTFRSTLSVRIAKMARESTEIIAEFEVDLEGFPWWAKSLNYIWENGSKKAVRTCEVAMLDTDSVRQTALDVEFLPLTLVHKIHRNLRSSQVEIVQLPYYEREPTPEEEPEAPGELEIETEPPIVTYAPPLQALKEKKNWWDFSKPVFAFNNPAIRSRLEMLMGSNVVRITDRKYMIKLQERIREDHMENLKKRIQEREADEVEREKKLILSGKISLDEAPKELKNHPICRINELAKKILEEKRAKMKVVTKTDMYKTSLKRIREAERTEREMNLEMEDEASETDQSNTMSCVPDAEVSEDICKGFMFTREEYDRLRYEAPLVKTLKEIDSVDEMYNLADQIVGPLKLVLK